MSDPIITISAQQMYDIVLRVERAAESLAAGVVQLQSIIEDHETRIRMVESRADEGRRIDALEARVTQHDNAFTRQGERLGGAEQQLTAIAHQVEKQEPARTPAIAVVAAILSALSIVVIVVLEALRA